MEGSGKEISSLFDYTNLILGYDLD